MNSGAHKIYLTILTSIVVASTAYMIYTGWSYYQTDLTERFYHEDYKALKPSGSIGHGIGIFGSLFIIVGVASYMARKRYRFMSRWGLLKHWLEFHIFLCTLGPILVLFHTSFKFGGLVAISFWSMVAVFLSGIAGRFIYLQIPRTIEGRQLSLNEVKDLKSNFSKVLEENYQFDTSISEDIENAVENNELRKVKKLLKEAHTKKSDRKKVLKFAKNEITLNKRIARLTKMQKLFEYWHVVHLPFALIMLVIMIIHIGVAIAFGYTWIF